MTFGAVVLRALRLRCPRCGGAPLFRSYLSMHDACPACGLDFRQESGYYVGAMWFNYGLTAATGLTAGLLLLDRVKIELLVAGLCAWGVLCPVLFFRHSRAFWLGLELWLRARTTEPGP